MTTYDRLDWHYDSTVEAGQPAENGFAHIGFFLAWMIHRDMHDPAAFPASHIAAVKSGQMTGSDLSDDIDASLGSDHFNAEGQAFADARYDAYLAAYEARFADRPGYSVSDDPQNYAVIAPVIDSLYAAWVADGRPAPPPGESDPPELTPMLPGGPDISPNMSPDEIAAAVKEMVENLGGVVLSPPTLERTPHAAPDLEALLPRDITSPPLEAWSVPATHWQSSLLNRALKRLGTRPGDATVVTGLGGSGDGVLTVTLYGVPGAPADRLASEFAAVLHLPPGAEWSEREMTGHLINWAEGPEFAVAFWARDDLVVHVAGRAADLAHAIPRLP